MPSADRVRWAKFRVSVVGVAAGAILITFFYLLTGGAALFEHKTTLYLYVPDATGLAPGSPVRVDGIFVGKVSSVGFSGSKAPERIVRVAMSVETASLPKIPVDSTAEVGAETMVGDRFVDVSSGTNPRQIRAGGEIKYESAPELLKTLDMEQFNRQLRGIDAMLNDIEQGESRVGRFIVKEDTYDHLRARLSEMERSMKEAHASTSQFGELVTSDRLYRSVLDPMEKLDHSLARLQAGQGAGRFLVDDALYAQMREAMGQLRASVARLRGGPLMTSDALYAEWTRRAGSLVDSVALFNSGPMLTSTQTYDALDGAARDLATLIRDVRENPKKYLVMSLF
jgi:phospholipid/cholesterol/gamma-HCH transport system substrate-binding protein